MNILNIQLPKIDPSVVWTVPTNLTQQAWNSLGGLKFQLPRIEANFFNRSYSGTKSRMEMRGYMKIADFNFKKSVNLSKQAPYAR